VLLDFRGGADDPLISYLGSALQAESGVDGQIDRISDVPGRSLLSRLTDHYLQIIANRAPIGFEAEFVNARGRNTVYRGILMPFSSDGQAIDFVYGAINWKELADGAVTAALEREVGDALRTVPTSHAPSVSLWADGPAATFHGSAGAAGVDAPPSVEPAAPPAPGIEPALAGCLAAARSALDPLRTAELRSRSALYRTLGLAYDLVCAAERQPRQFAAMLREAGIRANARGRTMAAVRLVFGEDYDRARLAEFATVMAHGRRLGVETGALRRLLEGSEGGLRAIVIAERAARRSQRLCLAADAGQDHIGAD
jgi:hypothetical protein